MCFTTAAFTAIMVNQKEEKVIGCVFGNVYPGFGERIGGSYGYGYGYGAYSRAER